MESTCLYFLFKFLIMKTKHIFRKTLFLCLMILLITGSFQSFKAAKGFLETHRPMPEDGMPYLFQYDDKWKDFIYGEGSMKETGCGPTSLAMALSSLTGESFIPTDIASYAEENGYYVEGAGTSWDLFTNYPALFGVQAYEVYNWADIQDYSNPDCVYIFSMGPGDFTSAGHIIAAKEASDKGTIHVHDPNSSNRSHPWKLEDLFSQANAVFRLE